MDLTEEVLAPHFGFKNVDEYYAHTQSVGQLHKIRVPTFFLNCIDDPIIDSNLYPYKELENNDYVISGFTKRGGHCGHFTGGFRPYQWFPQVYIEFLEHLEKVERIKQSEPMSISPKNKSQVNTPTKPHLLQATHETNNFGVVKMRKINKEMLVA